LEEYNRQEPVFALVGGMSKKGWQPVHMFSEEHKIPCILPVTDFPVISETDWYTLYFSKGFYQEGEAAARFLNDKEDLLKGRAIVQVVRDAPEGRALSAGFRETWSGLGYKEPVTVTLKAGERLTGKSLQQVMAKHKPAVLLLWAGSEALPALETVADRNRPAMAFVSASYLGESIWTLKEQVRDFTYITYPFRLPEAEKRYTAIVRSTLGPAYEKGDNLITSKKTYSIIRVLTQALTSMAGQYYRDALLDSIDMGRGSLTMSSGVQDETYPLYQRFSFGPGQRYASKGCYIVQLSKGPKPELVKRSDWVIH
jgi:ABC-type branched-subunit amino acid transport system substrate-binding protein